MKRLLKIFFKEAVIAAFKSSFFVVFVVFTLVAGTKIIVHIRGSAPTEYEFLETEGLCFAVTRDGWGQVRAMALVPERTCR